MKPRKEWFNLLPPDVEKMALENTKEWQLNDVRPSMDLALNAFHWKSTSQGYDFWNAIANDEKYK